MRAVAAAALALLSLSSLAHAFVPIRRPHRPPVAAAAGPMDMLLEVLKPQTFLAVLKEGKVGLVKSMAGEYDAPAVRAKMDKLVKDNKVLMLSFTTWPFCVEAKAVLDSKGAKYTAIELDKEEDGTAIRAEMGDMLGRTSVPAIWIKGTFIGGCNDGPLGGVNTLDKEGKLDGMLKAAGAL